MENNSEIQIIEIEEEEIEEVRPIEFHKASLPEDVIENLNKIDLPNFFNTVKKISKKNILLIFQMNKIYILTNETFELLIKQVKFKIYSSGEIGK
jgi:hypothetical protein